MRTSWRIDTNSRVLSSLPHRITANNQRRTAGITRPRLYVDTEAALVAPPLADGTEEEDAMLVERPV